MTLNPSPRPVWVLHTDRASKEYTKTIRDDVDSWLRANGIDDRDVLDPSTIRILQAGPHVFLATWRPDKELTGARVHCPFCQYCVRGHEVLIPLTTPLPTYLAVAGWPDADAPDTWLTDINTAALEQTIAPRPAGVHRG